MIKAQIIIKSGAEGTIGIGQITAPIEALLAIEHAVNSGTHKYRMHIVPESETKSVIGPDGTNYTMGIDHGELK